MPTRSTLRALLLAALLLPGPALALDGCPAPTTDATTRPAVRRGHEVRFRDRLDAISAALQANRYDVILLGDSIVQQWPRTATERAFPGVAVLNAGVSGDGAAALLFRLESRREPATVDGRRIAIGVEGWENQRPRTVVILIGTNDLRRAPPCDVAHGVAASAGRARRLWPDANILVLGILPRGPDGAELAAEIGEVNARLAAEASRPGASFRFADLGPVLACGGDARPCNLRRPPNHVHLTPEAYDRIAAAFRDAAPARRNPVPG